MTIKLMNASESSVVAELEVAAHTRTPRIEHDGQYFEASRQDADGTWIYRQQPKTK